MASAHKVIKCVDFGTYGFFVSYAHPTNPGRAQAIGEWPQMASTDYGKNLNAILLRKSNPEEILGYGFEAREKYMQAKEDDEHKDMMYFENFKLQLLQQDGFDTNKEILAIDGVSTRTLCPLVSQCLSKIVDHSLRYYREHEAPIELNEVLWVITVPAIWPLVSREAMKQCCVQIGIREDNVRIISEPEAAGSYLVWGTERGAALMEEDSYICVDAGSGTFDIVCHQLGDRRVLNELHYADGGRKGAVDVDRAFEKLLEDLIGEDVMTEFRERAPTEFVVQMQEFQRAREKVRLDDRQKRADVSEELEDMLQDRGIDLADCCNEYRIPGDDDAVVSFRKGKLTIQQKLWRYMHSSVVEAISTRVYELLASDDLESVQRLFLVGGFSQSAYIREGLDSMLRTHFGHIELISIHRPELAVSQGGLWHAAKQTIGIRQLPCTYGICVEREWDSRRGDPEERREVDPDYDTYKIGNIFHILFEKEDEWETGCHENFRYVVGAGVKMIEIDLYKSEERYPSFVDEVGCSKQATFVFELPEDEVRAHPQTLMMRCELTEDSIEMFVHLRNIYGRESHSSPFTLTIGRRD